MKRAAPWLVFPVGLLVGVLVAIASNSGLAGGVAGAVATAALVLGVGWFYGAIRRR